MGRRARRGFGGELKRQALADCLEPSSVVRAFLVPRRPQHANDTEQIADGLRGERVGNWTQPRGQDRLSLMTKATVPSASKTFV